MGAKAPSKDKDYTTWIAKKNKSALPARYIQPIGILLVLLYTIISASGGVYNEWLYKVVGKSTSIHLSNLQIYTFGIIFNAWGIVFTGGEFSIGRGHAPLRLHLDG